jgi:hypothetical protein
MLVFVWMYVVASAFMPAPLQMALRPIVQERSAAVEEKPLRESRESPPPLMALGWHSRDDLVEHVTNSVGRRLTP